MLKTRPYIWQHQLHAGGSYGRQAEPVTKSCSPFISKHLKKENQQTQADGRMDRQTDRQTDGWMHGQMDGQSAHN